MQKQKCVFEMEAPAEQHQGGLLDGELAQVFDFLRHAGKFTIFASFKSVTIQFCVFV